VESRIFPEPLMASENRFTNWLHRQKDSSTSFILERVLQSAFAKYGRMLNFYIDSRQRTAQVEVLLKGEKEALTIIVQDYELVTDEAGSHMLVKKATASREWVQVLINEFLIGKKFPIPAKYASMVKLVA
jgi:hypothetical protein